MAAQRLRHLSLALRTALASALFGLVIVSAGGCLGYWALSQQLEERSITELLGKRDLVTHVLSELPSVESVAASRHRFGDLLIGHDHVHLALVDPRNGQVLSSFSGIASESIRVLDANPMEAPVAWQRGTGQRLAALRGQAPVGDRLPNSSGGWRAARSKTRPDRRRCRAGPLEHPRRAAPDRQRALS